MRDAKQGLLQLCTGAEVDVVWWGCSRLGGLEITLLLDQAGPSNRPLDFSITFGRGVKPLDKRAAAE